MKRLNCYKQKQYISQLKCVTQTLRGSNYLMSSACLMKCNGISVFCKKLTIAILQIASISNGRAVLFLYYNLLLRLLMKINIISYHYLLRNINLKFT